MQNECRICAKQGNKIWNKNKNKKGVKLIAATLSRHVASPKAYNNDSSRPGRYIMPFKLKGTIIPVMNINRYYPILLF